MKNVLLISLFVLISVDVTAQTVVTSWGSTGTAASQFNQPWGVAVDASGSVYVTDYYNSRVEKFTSTGAFVTTWGSYGGGNGQFVNPRGIAVDRSSGDIYVTDEWSQRIQKFDSNGGFVTAWGSGGTGNGEFANPEGLAVDSLGDVYVTDFYNHRVQKFDANGNFLTTWGSEGIGDGQFENPLGIAIDSTGDVYVTDYFLNRIQKFTSAGVFLTKWGSYGGADGEFNNPTGVAVDHLGNVYVTDFFNRRVETFDANGAFLATWGAFDTPSAIGVSTSNGFLYVADSGNNTVSAFATDVTPPTITLSLTPSVLWPPDGRMVPVLVSGSIADDVSGVSAGSAAFAVQDSYDVVHASGAITLSNGSYSFTVPLPAARRGTDPNGRTYTVIVTAQDKAGNAGSSSATVIVPHDQRR